MGDSFDPVPLPERFAYDESEMRQRVADYYQFIRSRHTVRDFTTEAVPQDIIETCIKAAGTSPSGANHQPWHFVCVSDPAIKHQIREAAEVEERAFYGGKAGEEWLADLAKIGTDASKPFLETAPWLIAVFVERQGKDEAGNKRKNYYMSESVGIATGFLLNALHSAGLATLTHTPNPMKFLNQILQRPNTERPYILLVVGRAAQNATIPAAAMRKKTLGEIATFK